MLMLTLSNCSVVRDKTISTHLYSHLHSYLPSLFCITHEEGSLDVTQGFQRNLHRFVRSSVDITNITKLAAQNKSTKKFELKVVLVSSREKGPQVIAFDRLQIAKENYQI